MRKVWVVVANGWRAKIYEALNVNTLVEKRSFEHVESKLPNHELVSDRPGLATERLGNVSRTVGFKCEPKLKEKMYFAKEVAHELSKGFHEGKFERLYLIANPEFLSHIREHLNENIMKLVNGEIQKDLTLLDSGQIRDYLPPVL